jgi:hypothetical protein
VLAPSLVSEGGKGEIVFLVLDDFGRLGRAYIEADEKKLALTPSSALPDWPIQRTGPRESRST